MGTLWYNGIFYSMAYEGDKASALYEEDGKIIDIGTKKDLFKKWEKKAIHKRNVNGAVVFPGFVDSHLHLIAHGEKLLRLDLSRTNSKEEALILLAAENTAIQGEWIEALGWNEHNDPNFETLSLEDLNQISEEHPVFVMRICRHAAFVNQTALDLAGINEHTKDPVGGRIERDENGKPTGILHDQAVTIVQECMPKLSKKVVKRALEAAIKDCHQHGLTGGHSEDLHYYNGLAETINVYEETIPHNPFRAHLLIHHEEITAFDQSGFVNDLKVNPYIELGTLKIFADGALGGRTAALSTPYSDDPQATGLVIHTQEKLNDLVRQARERHLGVAIHVIGDAALEMALNAIEASPTKAMRDRLIHVQVARPDLIERMKRLKLIVDIQPRFVVSDFPWVENRLGTERLAYSFAWKTLFTNGINCAGGSDAPIEPVEPLLGIYAAVARRDVTEAHEGYGPSEKLSPFEAVALFTKGSAYAIGKEKSRGQLKPGYDADMTIVDRDLLTCSVEEIATANVIATVVDGKIVYERN
ncbi:amidohydrolase [Shouchella patagoniensis]|uniref:amidohydrolase n=1 Tax=Shouchella patagoniensis TaxID=228576 RepID=UPI000995B296|nr:amidohydrolase [Shouchella patagoniensis]